MNKKIKLFLRVFFNANLSNLHLSLDYLIKYLIYIILANMRERIRNHFILGCISGYVNGHG